MQYSVTEKMKHSINIKHLTLYNAKNAVTVTNFYKNSERLIRLQDYVI